MCGLCRQIAFSLSILAKINISYRAQPAFAFDARSMALGTAALSSHTRPIIFCFIYQKNQDKCINIECKSYFAVFLLRVCAAASDVSSSEGSSFVEVTLPHFLLWFFPFVMTSHWLGVCGEKTNTYNMPFVEFV
jgi:hypothetical protein